MKKFFLTALLFPFFLTAAYDYDFDDCCFDDNSREECLSCEQFEGPASQCTDCRLPGSESYATIDWIRTSECIGKYSFEFRVGGFQPSNSHVNKTYGSSVVYELEWNWRQMFCSLDGWVNVSFLSKRGHFGEDHLNTRLRVYPVSFGLKRSFLVTDNFILYAGLGASYTFAQGNFFDDNRHVHRQAWGFVAKGGLMYNLYNGVYLDFYGDYYYTGLSSHGDTINVGGFRGGLGIGFGY